MPTPDWSKQSQPAPPPRPTGYVITREDAAQLAGVLGSACDTFEQLKRAVQRCRTFSVNGAEVMLEPGVLERLASRAKAARTTTEEYTEREVKRLLASEVGY